MKNRLLARPAGGELKLLGVDGDRVWLFLREPIAVSLDAGAIVANAAMIEAENPALTGLLSSDKHSYESHDGLVLTATDATRHRIVLGTLGAARAARNREGMEGTPRGGGALVRRLRSQRHGSVPDPRRSFRRYLVRSARLERGEVVRGGRLNAEAKRRESVQRAFWTAKRGTEPGCNGHCVREHWMKPTRLADSPAFLQGGLLREAQTDPRALLIALETANGAIHSYAVEAGERANDAVDGATPEPLAAASRD